LSNILPVVVKLKEKTNPTINQKVQSGVLLGDVQRGFPQPKQKNHPVPRVLDIILLAPATAYKL